MHAVLTCDILQEFFVVYMHINRLRDVYKYYAYHIAVKRLKGYYNCLYRVLETLLRSGTRHSAFNLMARILRNTK